jgi:hypothetical protein
MVPASARGADGQEQRLGLRDDDILLVHHYLPCAADLVSDPWLDRNDHPG